MENIFYKIRSRQISYQFLVIVILLLLIPLLVMLYDLYFASKYEEAMIKDHEENLKSTVDSVIIPEMKSYLDSNSPVANKSEYLKKVFKNSFDNLVAGNPGVRFGIYLPQLPEGERIVIKGFLHQYRDLTAWEQKEREKRVLEEAKSGLTAVAASGKHLSKLTTSLNDETYEYLTPLNYKDELIAVAWADKRLNPIFAQSRKFLNITKYMAIMGIILGGFGSIIILQIMTDSVKTIKSKLKNMQKDINDSIPEMQGEFGEIADAINQMARSIVEKEKLEEELQRSQRLAALGRLVAGVAHELRNPIGIVKTTTQLMEQELIDKDVNISEHTSIINEQVDRQNKIIKELLQFGKSSESIKECSLVNSLVHKVLTFTGAMLRQHNIFYELDLKDDIPSIFINSEQIKRVFVNLILNAIEAMPEGGKLFISTFVESNNVCIKFTDTGRGIEAKEIKNIFDPFYTTKDHGTGLGLSICYKLVSLNNGHITVDTNENETSFTIKLPY